MIQKRLSLLHTYSWPGNVRELENFVERLAINAPTTRLISAEYLGFDLEFNALADPDKPREIMLSRELNYLNNTETTVRIC